MNEVLYGKAASLLMPDLIAHKGYYESRQFRFPDFDSHYGETIEDMQETTDKVLEELGQEIDATDELDDLARDYGLLVEVVATLGQLRLALDRHLRNYELWCAQDGVVMFDYHRRQLSAAVHELELLIAEGQNALEAAATAVDMMQTQLSKTEEDRRQLRDALLAFFALALALPEMIDREATRALLQWLGMELKPDDILPLLAAQAAIIFGVALLVGLLVWQVGSRSRG